MIRKIFSLSLLFAVVAWLIFSYLPTSLVALPRFSLLDRGIGAFFPALAVGVLVIFVGIQLALVYFTGSWFGDSDVDLQRRLRKFGLRARAELFWTGLPLLMTIGLALLSYYEYSF